MLDADIENLYVQYGHYLFTRCKNVLGSEDEAYDALQEVFVRVVKNRPKLDPERTPLAWLNRVTTNICLNRIRARRYRNHIHIDDIRDLADCSPSIFIARLAENRDLLRHLLDGVESRTQEVVLSYFFDERTAGQIADDIGTSTPTVRRILKRFIIQARARLDGGTTASVPAEGSALS